MGNLTDLPGAVNGPRTVPVPQMALIETPPTPFETQYPQAAAILQNFYSGLPIFSSRGVVHGFRHYGFLPTVWHCDDLIEAGRNSPCPCGSRKKFKRCCMR